MSDMDSTTPTPTPAPLPPLSSTEMRSFIQRWMKLDSEMATLQREISKRRTEKKDVSKRLMESMKSIQIDCFQVQDGTLNYNVKNVSKPISQRKLLQLLTQYYNGDMSQVMELNKYLMENRDQVVREEIIKRPNRKNTGEDQNNPNSGIV